MRASAFFKAGGLITALLLYSILCHVVLAVHPTAFLAAGLAIGPLMLVGMGCLLSSWRNRTSRSGSIKGLIVLASVVLIGLVWLYWTQISTHAHWVYLLQHLLTNALLGAIFAFSLTGGRLAVVTRLALKVHGSLPESMERYTRQVTIAWVIFFIGVCVVSLLLFFGSTLEVWSFFANILAFPLVALMFLAEYQIRRILHPTFEHVSIFAGIKAFWQSSPINKP